MEKPNIIFVLVDGLRSDQCFGKDKSSYTPFLDSLFDKGVYFKNTFASADGTIISLNCTFNSKFQSETGIRSKKLILLEDNHMETLKKSGYHLTGLIPNLTSLKPLREYFENDDCTFDKGPPYSTLPTGMTQRITSLLKSLQNKQPWFCYIHLFDLHPLREGNTPSKIDEFKEKQFGNSLYSQTVSSIDYNLKIISEQIDFNNTLVVLTADHGERIPHDDKVSFQFEPELKSITKIGRKILPKNSHNVGGKFLGKIKKTVGNAKAEYSNKELTPYQKRSRDPYFTLSLYDELLHIPFLISGLNLQSKIISNQVSTLQIFPTILSLVGITYEKTEYNESLVGLLEGKNIEEKEIFLHTMPYENKSSLDRIGIRSKKFKYFRNSSDPKKDFHLYDLENDPYENNNIANNNNAIIQKMELTLDKFLKNSSNFEEELNEEEDEIISEELKKLGYL
tara:strand:+ start:186 stop:1538 length:1353 start_codon:yes stop_codon:yes gene_type:complete